MIIYTRKSCKHRQKMTTFAIKSKSMTIRICGDQSRMRIEKLGVFDNLYPKMLQT